jgi:predicted dehydrogenase
MTIAVAIVGAGRMGKAHASNLAGIPEARIVGVADFVRDAATALAAGSGAAAFTDYQEMLARLRPDLVYFCTPASDHADQIVHAAEQGVNIFVEKPLATTVNEAKAAVAAVEQHGVLCTVGYQWRYSPTTNVAREALGDLPITLLGGWWYWTIPLVGWIKDKRLGGGQIFDQSTHVLDLMRFLAGDVSSIYAAYTRNAIPEADLPNWDAYALTLRFAQGAVGSLHSTYALFPKIPNSNSLDVVARELLVRVNLARTVVFRRDQAPVETPAVAGWNIDQAIVPIIARNDAAAIRATARESMRSLAVTLAANYSAETGKIVDLAEFVATPPTDVAIMPDARPAFVR